MPKMNAENKTKLQDCLESGHGVYSMLFDEKEFFEMAEHTPNIVVLFYRAGSQESRLLDWHLNILAAKHLEAKFYKLNIERAGFLQRRLRIESIPEILLVKDGQTADFIVGFQDLGNSQNFSTEMLECRLAESGTISYKLPDGKRLLRDNGAGNMSKNSKKTPKKYPKKN